MRILIRNLTESSVFKLTIISLILANAVILGVLTSDNLPENYKHILRFADDIILFIFTLEILLKIFALHSRFFNNSWNIFDFIVVGLSLILTTEFFAAFRTLRILKLIRLVSTVPALNKSVNNLLKAVPGMLSVFSIMIFLFYIFSIIGTHLYGHAFPQWFGSIGKTMFTLFQIMTLEGWSMNIVRPVMELYPASWIFFILFILVTTFTTLNLFIAILVSASQESTSESAEESRMKIKSELAKEIHIMEKRIIETINSSQKK